jgi:septum formation protein
MDKAGAYAIQEHGEMLGARWEGELENIIGLPLRRLNEKLHRFLA